MEPTPAQERVVAPGAVEGRRRERGRVVRAEEPEVGPVGKREVEERFVTMALDELGRVPIGRDRLADSP